ncbi:MAG: hypothetical protein MRK00_04805 [Nitrosomonas sp.]|nr:hypothetical protein [Nitrosomonas sp.]
MTARQMTGHQYYLAMAKTKTVELAAAASYFRWRMQSSNMLVATRLRLYRDSLSFVTL